MLYLIATLEAKPGHAATIAEAVRKCSAETVTEAGCISYDCHVSLTQPDRYVFVERWASQQDLDAHAKSAHVQAWRATTASLWAGPSAVEIVTPANVLRR